MPVCRLRTSRTVSCVASSILPRSQGADGHAPAGHLLLEDLDDRLELTLVIGQDRQRIVLLVELDRGAGPLEVEADGQLVLRLHDRVVHLGVVDLADDVEGMIVGHGPEDS